MTDKGQEEVRGPGVGGQGSELNLFIRRLQWNSFRVDGLGIFSTLFTADNQ